MINNYISLQFNRFLLIFISISISYSSNSQLVITNQGGTAATILSGFIGSGLTITNPVITCPTVAYGTFAGGTGIGVTNGVLLTTGNASNIANPESFDLQVDNNTNCNDPQLVALEPLATNDCCVLEFDVVPSCNSLSVRFVFGSEEYPDFAPPNGGVNDVFGFFVTGPNPAGGTYTNKNIAIVTGTTICSIDNVNPINNPSFFVDNAGGTVLPFGGYTTAITSTLSVTPCQSYHFKIAIADAMDGIYDSAVLIDFLQCSTVLTATTTATAASCGVNDGTAACVALNGMGVLSYTWSPAPGAGQGTANVTGLTGGTVYTCVVDDIYACILPVTTTVTVPGAAGGPVVTNTPLVQTICSGSNTSNVTLTGDIVGTTFVWTATATAGITGFTANGTSTIPVQTLLNSGATPGTVTYVITPTAAGCPGTPVNYVITVNPQITPTFTAIGTLCQNATVPILASSSTNTPTIPGTWSPATVSTATLGTTTYTFTPSVGQCATTTTLNVIISTPVTPTFTAISNVCQNVTAPVLPLISNNNVPGTWLPAVSTATAGTTIYTFTPTAGQCAVSTTLNITVDPSITATVLSVSDLCLNSVAPILSTSSTNTPPLNGTWSPATISTAAVGTIVYTFTPTGSCLTNATISINTVNQITPTFASIPNPCQNSTAPLLPTSSTNTPTITGAWNSLVSTAIAGATTYTFTPAAGQCATTATLIVTVNAEITPTFASIPNPCQNSTAPLLLTSSTNIPSITGTWNSLVSTATAGTTTYTFTPTAGQCAINSTLDITVNPLITPTFSPVANVCQNSIAIPLPTSSTNVPSIPGSWLPIVSTINSGSTVYTFTPSVGQCANTTTLSGTVDPEITPTFDAIATLCLNDLAPTLPITSTNGISGTWLPVVSTAAVGTTTYTFTPTPGGCSPTTTLDITVSSLIIPLFTTINPICVGSTVPVLQASSNNIPAITGLWLPIVSIATAGTTTYTFTPTAGQCASNTTLDIIVNPLPILVVNNPVGVCMPLTVDLTLSAVTAGSSGGTISYCTSPTGLTSLPNASNISTSGTYFIVNETNLGCKVILPVVVEIYSKPLASFVPTPSVLNTYNLISTMINNSANAVSYEWYFMDGGTSNLDNPTHEFPDSTYGDQNILLIATSAEGCKDTTIKAITIEEELIIYIPNTFTPDIDNFNPTFQPVFTSGYDAQDYTLLIFDRWGEIVFESHDTSIGWNGKLGNSNKVQDGVYTWKIEFKLSKKDEHRMLVGSVNLVR